MCVCFDADAVSVLHHTSVMIPIQCARLTTIHGCTHGAHMHLRHCMWEKTEGNLLYLNQIRPINLKGVSALKTRATLQQSHRPRAAGRWSNFAAICDSCSQTNIELLSRVIQGCEPDLMIIQLHCQPAGVLSLLCCAESRCWGKSFQSSKCERLSES